MDQIVEDPQKVVHAPFPFRDRVVGILFLVAIFFLNCLSRFIWGPLLVNIEEDLSIRHTEAGSLFVLITAGYFFGLFLSGFISSRLNHQKTVIVSCLISGVLLVVATLAPSMLHLCVALGGLGFATGLYLPTGVACLTYRLEPKDFGKAIGFHEMAPSLGFIAGPLLAEVMLNWGSWREALLPVGLAMITVGIAYSRKPWTGDFRGEPLSISNARYIGSVPAFWWIFIPFIFSVGANVGVFSMLPLYLQAERGMDQTFVNMMLSASRLAAVVAVAVTGWAMAWFDGKSLMISLFFLTATFTALLGLLPTDWLWFPIFMQPLLAAAFFVPTFSILSRTLPAEFRSLIISVIVSVGMLIGGGLLPIVIGAFGDAGKFHTAFAVVGFAAMTCTFLLFKVPLPQRNRP